MNNEPVSNEELTKYLSKLNWDVLKTKKPEFIIRMVIKKLRANGVGFSKVIDQVEVEVVPVTTWDINDPVHHNDYFVYECFRGYRGTVLGERVSNGTKICAVKLKPEGKRPFVTEIKKDDLKTIV